MSAKPRLDALQALRAIAALLVVAFHLHAAAIAETGTSGLFVVFQRGEIGVDLFFVLSGFIITWAALHKPDLTPGAFLAARFWRVVPPYWAALVLYLSAFAGLAIMTGDASRLPGLDGLVISALLLPAPGHVVIVAWSLTLEALFYALFAVTWFRARKTVFITALAAWAIGALVAEQTGHSDSVGLILHPAVPEFLLGAMVARLHARGKSYAYQAAFTLGAVMIGIGATGALDPAEASLGRAITFGVPAAFLIYGAAGLRWTAPRWVLVLGDASYVLYLLHLLVFYVVGRGVEMLIGLNVYTSPLAMLALLACAVIVSVAAHLGAERPYQRWSKRRPAQTRQLVGITPAR